MTAIRMVKLGGSVPMGQQVYERQLRVALDELGGDWRLTEVDVVPFSADPGPAVRRLPMRVVWRCPFTVARLIGRWAYGPCDVVHRLDLRCPPAGGREVVTIHDLPPLRFDDEGTIPHWAPRSAREAAAVICPSEFAAAEIRELLHVETVHVVPYGVDESWATVDPLSNAELEGLGLRGRVVLHAAGATRRKNLEALAAAWPEVRSREPEAVLALCGPAHPRRDELFDGVEGVRRLGAREPGFVARLMRAAEVVVVPSVYEGFGLPALEAMAAGTPAVAAACGALPEVCRDGALLVDPTAEAVAAGIVEALSGGEGVEARRTRGIAIAREFTWARAAVATAAIYQAVLG